MQNLEEVKSFIEYFNKKYYEEGLELSNKLHIEIEQIEMNTNLYSIFDFAPEESDDFMAMFFDRYDISRKNYIHGLHFDDLMKIKLFFTNILKPFIGLKKWMLLSEEERIKLKVSDLCKALENKKINSYDFVA